MGHPQNREKTIKIVKNHQKSTKNVKNRKKSSKVIKNHLICFCLVCWCIRAITPLPSRLDFEECLSNQIDTSDIHGSRRT